MKNFIFAFFILILILSFSFQVFAQSSDGSADGTTPPASDPSSPIPPETPGGATTPPTEPASSGTTPAPTPSATPTTPTPPRPTPKTQPKTPINQATIPTPVLPMQTLNNEPALEPSSSQSLILWALGAVALGTLGFFGLNLRKKKKQDEKNDDKKCGNIKKLMEDKLNELTDLKGQLASLAKGEANKQIKNAVAGTKTGEILVLMENGKKEYERLKKLYEKCILDFSIPKTTLLFLYKPQERKILLAMKKRDFGKGKWNGIGGKLNEGETVKDALVREAQEEIGVTVNPNDLVQMVTLDFSFKDNSEWNQQSHVFFAEKWIGEPIETEEMSPKWFSVNALPYENMWVDDPHWLPLVLEGKKLNAKFNFNKLGDKILDMKINLI